MYTEIAQSVRSPTDCDVHALAARVIAEAEACPGIANSRVHQLQQDIREIFAAVGRLEHHNDRYRALCLQFLLQEHVVELCVAGDHLGLRPIEWQTVAQKALHAAVGTLRQIASTMIGPHFKPSGGLTMTRAEDLVARAGRLERLVSEAAPRSLLAAHAAAEPAHLALMCGEKALGQRLRSFEIAATGYEKATARFLVASGADSPSFNLHACSAEQLHALWTDQGFSGGKQFFFLRAFSRIVSGLSRSYVHSGQPEEARRAALLNLDIAQELNIEVSIVNAELQIAEADEHLDHIAAINRLERVLSDERTTRLMLGNDRATRYRIVGAMGRLALLLNAQGATAARQHWVKAAEAWLDDALSAHQKLVKRRITDADVWRNPDPGMGWDARPERLGIVRPRSRGGLADPTEDGAGRSLFYLCRDINACVEAQHLPGLVWSLARLAGMLLDRGKKFSQLPRPERATELGQVLRKVDEWRPARRVRHLTGPLSEHWLTNLSTEALRVAELCWEFADHYEPTAGLIALKIAGRAAVRVYGNPGHEQHLKYWREAAKRAHGLGDWRLEVNAELKVAWSCEAAIPPRKQDATFATRRAYHAMKTGFRRLADLYEVTMLLNSEWAVYPARIARAFAKSDPQSWEAFSALDFGQGLALSAMRSAKSHTLHELVTLQHEEHQLIAALGQGDTADIMDRLRKVRDRILDLTRRGGSLLLEESGPGEQTDLLWQLGPEAAVIQLGKTKNDIVVSAARLVDGQIHYHSFELGQHSKLASLMKRMWNIVDIDPVSRPELEQTAPSALDEAYRMLIAPLREFLAGTTSWHVVAHDDLAGLPVHAIRTPQGRFVIEDVAVGYAPSVKSLLEAPIPPDAEGQALVIGAAGDPAAGHEVQDVASLIEAAGVGVVTEDSGPSRMLSENHQWRVIHIVAHGESRPFPEALTSYLEFDEVRVTAQDVLDRGTRAGLVFINACHLAKSSPFGGDLYGFPFAFLASGTPVIAAAAPIYRPYANWFAQDLHRALLAGRSPLEAYAGTVRSCIADPWQRHPVFWAPYFYVGGCGTATD